MSEVAGLMCCRYALKSNMLFGVYAYAGVISCFSTFFLP